MATFIVLLEERGAKETVSLGETTTPVLEVDENSRPQERQIIDSATLKDL